MPPGVPPPPFGTADPLLPNGSGYMRLEGLPIAFLGSPLKSNGCLFLKGHPLKSNGCLFLKGP